MKTIAMTVLCVLFAAGSALAQGKSDAKKPAEAKGAAPAAAAAPAADAAPMGPPKPAPEFEAYMKPFEGSWKCETHWPAGAMGPGSPDMKGKSNVKFKKDLGGMAYRGEYKTAKSKDLPMAFNGVFYMTYDPGSKNVVNVSVDNTGGSGMATGPISGTSVTLTGEGYMMGKKLKYRETMTSNGPKSASHKYEVDTGKGFTLMGEDECKK